MAKTAVELAAEVQRIGLVRDNDTFTENGISPVTPEAIPYYVAWIRTDIVLSAAILGHIAEDIRELVKYARITVVILFIIAIAVVYARFRG